MLTPLGEKEHYDLGVWLLNRYSSMLGPYYNASWHRLESSALERTLVSANSLALGLFPESARIGADKVTLLPVEPANVPVYATGLTDDVTIRAYANCPAFDAKLQQLYASSTWTDLETQNIPLLTLLATYFPDQLVPGKIYIPLTNVWNCFDAINVAKTECQDDPSQYSCAHLPDPSIRDVLSASDWVTLQELAHTAESLRYESTTTAGPLLGSNLVREIMSRIPQPTGRFFLYSAHYPTIFGVLATLQVKAPTFPDYAAALIFEVYEDNTTTASNPYSIQLWYKSGPNATTAVPIPLTPACGGSATLCDVSSFSSWASQAILSTDAVWCQECNNAQADVCLANLALGNMANGQSSGSGSSSPTQYKNLVGPVLGSLFGGIVLGIVLGICFANLCRKKPSLEPVAVPQPTKSVEPDSLENNMESGKGNSADEASEPGMLRMA